MRNFFFRLLVVLNLIAPQPAISEDLALIVFEAKNCFSCIKWQEEIGLIYNKTEIGTLAPMQKKNIHDSKSTELNLARGIVFTPTFILAKGNSEIGRIVGYIGDFQFWSELEKLIIRHKAIN